MSANDQAFDQSQDRIDDPDAMVDSDVFSLSPNPIRISSKVGVILGTATEFTNGDERIRRLVSLNQHDVAGILSHITSLLESFPPTAQMQGWLLLLGRKRLAHRPACLAARFAHRQRDHELKYGFLACSRSCHCQSALIGRGSWRHEDEIKTFTASRRCRLYVLIAVTHNKRQQCPGVGFLLPNVFPAVTPVPMQFLVTSRAGHLVLRNSQDCSYRPARASYKRPHQRMHRSQPPVDKRILRRVLNVGIVATKARTGMHFSLS